MRSPAPDDAHPPAHDAAATWSAERDLLLRGLNHALSNRVGTLASVAALLEPGVPARPPFVDALRDETERLERLLALYRLLPVEGGDGAEPVHVPDLLPGVMALHAEHPELRDVPCAVEEGDSAVPARARVSALVHALLLALSAAKRAAGEGGRVRLAVSAGTGAVRVSAIAERAGGTDADDVDRAVDAALHADAAGRLLAPDGGGAHARADGGVDLRLRAAGG